MTTEEIESALKSERGKTKLVRKYDKFVRAPVRVALRRWPRRAIGAQCEEDFVQQVFAQIFEDGARILRAYDPARAKHLGDYLSNFTASRLIEAARKELRRQEIWRQGALDHVLGEGARRADRPDELLYAIEVAELLRAALDDRLTDKGREMLKLMYDQQLEVDELVALGHGRSSVYGWRSRIRSVAASCLEKIRGETLASHRRVG